MGKESLKKCEMFDQGRCLGCVGLAEKDWIGAEQCEIFKKLSSIRGIDLCKKILKGEQQRI